MRYVRFAGLCELNLIICQYHEIGYVEFGSMHLNEVLFLPQETGIWNGKVFDLEKEPPCHKLNAPSPWYFYFPAYALQRVPACHGVLQPYKQ